MNLAVTISLFGGGPGSGCHGPNCGRPGGSDVNFVDDIPSYYKKEAPPEFFRYTDTVFDTLDLSNVEVQHQDLVTQSVRKWQRAISRGKKVPALVVAPNPKGGYFLLDGNHRAVALEDSRSSQVRVAILKPKEGFSWVRKVNINTRSVWFELEKK